VITADNEVNKKRNFVRKKKKPNIITNTNKKNRKKRESEGFSPYCTERKNTHLKG